VKENGNLRKDEVLYFDPDTEQQIIEFYINLKQTSCLYQQEVILQAADRIHREYQGQPKVPNARSTPSFYQFMVRLLQRSVRRLIPVFFLKVPDQEMVTKPLKTMPVIVDVAPIPLEDERSVEIE